jgi:hypothetical protein
MHVKVFIGTILVLTVVTIGGLFTWAFPIVNMIHVQLGGKPLADPRGSLLDQANTWLSYLPSDGVEKTQFILYIVAAYLLVTVVVTIVATSFHNHRLRVQAMRTAKQRTMHYYSAQKQDKTQWVAKPVSNEYTREEPL